MRYINGSPDRRLVVMRMTKKWVNPGQVVDLNSTDIRMLGANGAFMRPATEDESKVAKQAPVAAPSAEKKAAPKKSDDKVERKAVKDSLDEYTKSGLVDIAGSLGIEVKSKDNKGALTKKIMAAAKKIGYANAVKKAGI